MTTSGHEDGRSCSPWPPSTTGSGSEPVPNEKHTR